MTKFLKLEGGKRMARYHLRTEIVLLTNFPLRS